MKLEHSDFLSTLNKQDILFLTETWQRDTDYDIINNTNFIEYSVCRSAVKTAKRNSGGITVLIKKHLSEYITHIKSYNEGIIWFKIPTINVRCNCDIYICCVYISPKYSSRYALNDDDLYEKLYNDVLMYNDIWRHEL